MVHLRGHGQTWSRLPKGAWEHAVCVIGPSKTRGEVKLSADLGSGAPDTELQGDPSAHSAHEGTGTTGIHITQQTQITRGNPPNRATEDSENISNRRQFNINFTQINLNQQKAATGDLALIYRTLKA